MRRLYHHRNLVFYVIFKNLSDYIYLENIHHVGNTNYLNNYNNFAA